LFEKLKLVDKPKKTKTGQYSTAEDVLSYLAKDHAIIKQVLEYGLIKDWQQLQKTYGIDKIAESAKTYRELDKKALSFISFLSKTPIEEFRCYNYQQSIPHWNF
jgi:hypothetical protein